MTYQMPTCCRGLLQAFSWPASANVMSPRHEHSHLNLHVHVVPLAGKTCSAPFICGTVAKYESAVLLHIPPSRRSRH